MLYEYFHFPLFFIGIIFGINAISGGISQIYGGILGDKYGLKITIIVFSAFSTLGYFLQFLTVLLFRNGPLFVSLFILTNIIGSLYQPSSNALLALSRKNTLGSFSIMRIMTNMGWAVGPAIGGFLIDSFGFYSIYLISFVTALIAFISYFFLINIGHSSEANFSKLAISDRKMITYGIGALLLFIIVSQFSVTLSIYASVFTSVNFGGIGLIYLTNGLIVVTLQWPVYMAIRKIGMWNGILIGNILYMLGYFSMGFDRSLVSFLFSMIVVTMGENFTTPTANTIASIIAKEGRMASYMGAFNFFTAMGRSIGPTFGSIVLSLVHNRVIIWSILISPGFISAIIFTGLRNKIKAQQ